MHLALRAAIAASALTIGIMSPAYATSHDSPDPSSNSRCEQQHAEHSRSASTDDHGDKRDANYCAAQVGDLVDVSLNDLHPTQAVLGYDEVYYKLGRYTMGKDTNNKKFADWCEANGQQDVLSTTPTSRLDTPSSFTCVIPLGSETADSMGLMKTGVVGPDGQMYLTDGHHTFTSFWETADGGRNMHVRVRIVGNLGNLEPDAFWKQMKANNWVWLFDKDNKGINPDQLPEHLGLKEFGNDPYRGVIYFARDIGYQQLPAIAAFQEFYWGQWMRQSSNPDLNLASYNLRRRRGQAPGVQHVGLRQT
jgi:hypothetical protein